MVSLMVMTVETVVVLCRQKENQEQLAIVLVDERKMSQIQNLRKLKTPCAIQVGKKESRINDPHQAHQAPKIIFALRYGDCDRIVFLTMSGIFHLHTCLYL